MNITDEHIEKAKLHTTYSLCPAHHEHPDCIRIAVEWLSAQQWVKRPNRQGNPIKHVIEIWGGRYISQSDVEVAAVLLGLEGRYPNFNISSKLTRPSMSRLGTIGEALKHKNYLFKDSYDSMYARLEARP
ncbi:MAG: hypothetical protein JZU65_07195 [Chlorobium sp.]|nr:hypothetical protein [Chlorobium sp.]